MLKRNLTIAISVTLMVILMLALVRTLLQIPKPLFLFIILTFVVTSLLFWAFKIKKPNLGMVQISVLLFAWIFSTSIILGSVYHIDKAGWNWFQLTGYDVAKSESYHNLVDVSVQEFINRYPYFSVNPQNETKVILQKGVYEIIQTVIIPKNLQVEIEPGAVLRFDTGCSLISYSPIFAMGTEVEPILFTAKNRLFKWGVVGIVDTDKSIFKHVKFEHGRHALINDVNFFGGLSLIRSDVVIKNSTFENMYGKDAINVQDAEAVIQNNRFENVYKDGVDVDGGSGEISFNEFINCQDEGIDLSGNFQHKVFENRIVDEKGGRIGADNKLAEIRAQNSFGYYRKK